MAYSEATEHAKKYTGRKVFSLMQHDGDCLIYAKKW